MGTPESYEEAPELADQARAWVVVGQKSWDTRVLTH
jgi:hypothetical protein